MVFGCIRFYTGILLPPAPIPFRLLTTGPRERAPIVPAGKHVSSMKPFCLAPSRIQRTGTAGWTRVACSGLAENYHEFFAIIPLAPHGR